MNPQDLLDQDPLKTFESWFKEAEASGKLREPRAMALATLSPDGRPHNRIVLFKDLSDEGVTFYTNYDSQKGKDLSANPFCEVVFYWDPLGKQVRISGSVQKTSRETSEAYWATRPRESQLSQHVSRQSTPVESREQMIEAVEKARRDFANKEIPLPENWGGYLLIPSHVELWIADPARLHDRFVFSKFKDGWTSARLHP
ncbi:MAG: pyridoxamine 5'-phosphate oxidase [Bdellovibrionaceae bacterium]|nr:pyridoxamine 5'-phosphate oxidase [Pseudobdellovibrionaceae bacterium]|tara:strand:- start:18 stop:617 length:600 start_codon:yes stop_codon:yes gene_type:complete